MKTLFQQQQQINFLKENFNIRFFEGPKRNKKFI